MKKLLCEVMIILLFMGACQKEPEWQESQQKFLPGSEISRDGIHDVLAKTLAGVLSDRQVRQLLHAEIARQFTGDFDILYDLIKDRELISEDFGLISFSALLSRKAGYAGLDLTVFTNSLVNYKNLQISSPVWFEKWDPDSFTPLVISLPVDYQEGSGRMVKAYNSEGAEILVSENNLNEPFLLVRQAERVDENGMMRVDPDGFVIPEEERIYSAKQVYELSETPLKSASLISQERVIEVLDGTSFREALLSRRFPEKEAPAPVTCPEGKILLPGLKSANSMMVAVPGNFRVNPAGPGTIQISWSQVTGAACYEIYRQYGDDPNYLLAVVGPDQINYYDQFLSTGEHYIYSVRAKDASGNESSLTDGLESYASWRTNGVRDVVDKIYIDTDCWNWCCGLFDGKIELQYKISYLYTPSKTNVAYPGSGLNNLGQKTKDQQKGKWCTYAHYLFPWDIRTSSYTYIFKVIEDDGSGDGKTIKLSTTFKIQLVKIVDISVSPGVEFKVADKDEEFGEVIIQYWDRKNGPGIYTDGYNLMPRKGNARMYLRQ